MSAKKIEPLHAARQDPFGTALEIALKELRSTDLEERCLKAGAVWAPHSQAAGVVDLFSLGRGVRIRLPEGFFESDGDALPSWERILLLHYLITASGAPPTGRMITFKQVPSGAFYYPAFVRRTTQLLIKNFGGRLEDWLEVADRLGWSRAPCGDAAVEVKALPMVRIIYILWKGDEEFPPDGNVIFDENITQYLPVEDIAVLCNMIAVKMVREDKK